MYRAGKSLVVLILFILAGIVLGGFLGSLAADSGVKWLSWLNYGLTFGIKEPVLLDLSVITLTFGIMIRFTVSGIIGMALAIFIYRKM